MVAKLYLDRIKKRVGYYNETLHELMQKIIAFNNEKVHNAVYRIKKADFEAQNKKIREDKRFILPDMSEVLPKRSVFVKKAVIRGRLITDDFRNALTKDLRDTLDQFKQTGDLPWVRRTGVKAGELNPRLIDDFRGRITSTFQAYTKKDPRYGGMPSNIRNIAVTEITSTINQVKKDYHDRFMQINRDAKAFKTWLHSLDHGRIKHFRQGHYDLHNQTIAADDLFMVKYYVMKKKKWVFTGQIDRMDRPHDPAANLRQIVGCMCSVVYSYRKAEK